MWKRSFGGRVGDVAERWVVMKLQPSPLDALTRAALLHGDNGLSCGCLIGRGVRLDPGVAGVMVARLAAVDFGAQQLAALGTRWH